MTMTKVRAVAPHENEYGDAHEKAIGDEYDAPDTAALTLEANGYVEFIDLQDGGRPGVGSGAGAIQPADGKGRRAKGA